MFKNKIFVVVDVESNGPIVSKDEMTSFGAVIVENELKKTFYARLECKKPGYMELVDTSAPIETPMQAMERFENWLNSYKTDQLNSFVFVSDNPCFDWQFINYYFLTTIGRNPFGFSGRRIGDIWSGLTKNINDHSDWRKFVKTTHDHNPTNDAIGHGEALLEIVSQMQQNSTAPKEKVVSPARKGDWVCPICNVVIWASKLECAKCHSKKN
jgi:hypothetical protein